MPTPVSSIRTTSSLCSERLKSNISESATRVCCCWVEDDDDDEVAGVDEEHVAAESSAGTGDPQKRSDKADARAAKLPSERSRPSIP